MALEDPIRVQIVQPDPDEGGCFSFLIMLWLVVLFLLPQLGLAILGIYVSYKIPMNYKRESPWGNKRKFKEVWEKRGGVVIGMMILSLLLSYSLGAYLSHNYFGLDMFNPSASKWVSR